MVHIVSRSNSGNKAEGTHLPPCRTLQNLAMWHSDCHVLDQVSATRRENVVDLSLVVES